MIDLNKQVCVFLWYSATKETIRSISDRFNITTSCLIKILRRMALAIKECMLKDLIKWPSGYELIEIVNGFKNMKNIDGVIGAIDGSHIPIIGQTDYGENYINRKGFPSIVLQAVCDHKMRFTDCYVGWPGSVHDARVFDNSDLLARIRDDPAGMVPDGTFMVGDAAYKLETFMMTPYKNTGHFTQLQRTYNYSQSATRTVIERSFAMLKSRFARLKMVEMSDLCAMTNFVIAVCTLHNFCIAEDDRLGGEDYFEVEEDHGLDLNNIVCYGSSSKDAERKRSDIAQQLNN